MNVETATSAPERYLAEHDERLLAELTELLRIPSISTPPINPVDMERAATWVADRLRAAGVPTVELLPNPDGGSPVVYGRLQARDDKPTVMIYAHYDVQPVDPLDRWRSPPFEPAIRDGAIYARGATDDKGMLVAAIAAVEALVATGHPPELNLLFCIEGAEETLTTGLAQLVRFERERFACDVIVSADGTMHSRDHLSITVSTKGVSALAIELQTATSDLHSGMFGANVPNAAQATARLVATFHDAEGRVAVDGFYDDVRELTPEERAEFAATPFDAATMLATLGVDEFWGEPGYTPWERKGARPTVDVVEIASGGTGEKVKPITPHRATAKMSCRLVPHQDPERILDVIERHIERHCPPGATITVKRFPGIDPSEIRRDHPALRVAREVLREMGGQEPIIERSGGSLPIAPVFQRELGADMVFFAWGMPDASVHVPNEFLRLDDFRACARGYCRLLTRLANALHVAR